MILADASYQDVGESVVVEVAGGDSQPVHLDVEAGAARHI